ncbi:hypothetical protein [Vibrio aestuarianus]|uniref:PLAT domain-containing protein n=1 Tax=Vibrio aestuarianus TaxID=28171 RepID=A0AAX3U0S5_9VIBR|nr:hypothetical protein [Vibrio aestuarianus]MDE1340193.1 hypothetical protein [Vibrio aestuarianus]WGK80791.1 hypothetical protein PYE51_09050 [Vibrio aestuarianus]
MIFFKILFIFVCMCVSSFSFSDDKIYSSDVVMGSLRAYLIEFKIEFKDEGGSGGNARQDPYGKIIMRMNDADPDFDMVVFDRSRSNSLTNVNSITLRATVMTSKGGHDPYFTLVGSWLRDDDPVGSDKLCDLKDTVMVHQSQVGEVIQGISDSSTCKAFKLFKFTAL